MKDRVLAARAVVRTMALLVLSCVCLWHCAATETAHAPNVLFITVDTLRADHLGCYGYPKNTSPVIDALASEGTLFETVMAPRGATYPSLVSLHTSLYPAQHGVRSNRAGHASKDVTMLAEILGRHGYATGAFVANAQWGDWQGFDTVEHHKDGDLNRHGLAWIESLDEDQPFFLWMHYYLPHAPYDPREPYRSQFVDRDYGAKLIGADLHFLHATNEDLSEEDVRYLHGLYDGEIKINDDLIKDLTGALREADVLDSTLLVLTADHGEMLWSRNRYSFHHASVHDAALHVPLIVRYPGKIAAGQRVSGVAELTDVAPTVLQLLELPIPDQYQGRSLVAAMNGESLESNVAFSELEDKIVTLRTARYRYVSNPTDYWPITVSSKRLESWNISEPPRYPIDTSELFDLDNDPREHHNLAAERPDLAEHFQRMLEDWQRRTGWSLDGAAASPKTDPALLEKLEALGYVGE